MKPPEKYLTDEASGIQYINPRWEAWQEDMKAFITEMDSTWAKFIDSNYVCFNDFYKEKIEQLREEVDSE